MLLNSIVSEWILYFTPTMSISIYNLKDTIEVLKPKSQVAYAGP